MTQTILRTNKNKQSQRKHKSVQTVRQNPFQVRGRFSDGEM